jgi:Restriction endonuclease BglII
MKLHHKSHLFGQTIVERHFPSEYEELTEVFTKTPLPLRDAQPYSTGRRSTPKRQWRTIGGTKKRILLPVDLPSLNVAFDVQLRKKHWSPQPYASDDVFAVTGDRSRGDFAKNNVFVEVEFGNTASLFRDLFKFQIASRERKGDVAVLVVGLRRLMKFHDSGVATFEKVDAMLPYLRIALQMPVWIVGLEPESWDDIRQRYEEMLTVAQDHGEECLPYETAFGVDIHIEDEPPTGSTGQ